MSNQNDTPRGDGIGSTSVEPGGSVVPAEDSVPSKTEPVEYEEVLKKAAHAAAKLLQLGMATTSTIKPQRLAVAAKVIEAYKNLMGPSVARQEVHIVDHAHLATIRQAQKVMGAYNEYLTRQKKAGGRFRLGDN